eukprot:GEMP01080136.1.p1 GENE.GEMP01080136.1~~GEMP01080136.1.p1  ORF type:complete len:279 (-),score=73.02 GEMP01080136.1:239-1027(-)
MGAAIRFVNLFPIITTVGAVVDEPIDDERTTVVAKTIEALKPESLFHVGLETENRTEALQWYLAAAKQKYTPAMVNAAHIYMSWNDTGAIRWLKKAALLGDAEAQYLLGVQFLTGDMVDKNLTKAQFLFGEAAASGNVLAMYNVARLEQNETVAVEWYEHAVSKGCAKSSYALGVRALEMNTTDMAEQALQHFLVAAKRNHTKAAYNAATLTVDSDPNKAETLAGQAAKDGMAEAMWMYGWLLKRRGGERQRMPDTKKRRIS